MSRIDEFTSVAGIPPVGMAGRGAPTNPKLRRRKRSVVDSFVSAPATLSEETQDDETLHAPVAPVAAPAAVAAPTVVVPAAAAPVVAPTAAPVAAEPTPVAETATKALMISKQVAEALMSGHSVTVRGVLLEPTFKPSVAKAVAGPVAESAAAAILRATGVSESMSEPVDMNAAQPPPAPPSDGKAVTGAFRRFAGGALS